MQAGDGTQPTANDGAGEIIEGRHLVDVEGVDGVEHVRGFGVDPSAGFQQCHVGRRHGAQAWMKRNLNGGTASADWIGGRAKSAARVSDPTGDLHQMNDGASKDIGIDFQPKFQRQASEEGTIQLGVWRDLVLGFLV